MTKPTPKTKTRRKCTAKRYCTLLESRMLCETPGTHGLVDGTLLVLRSGTMIQTPAFYKVPKRAGKPPVYLNFCPFCGFDFRAKLEKFFRDVRKARGTVREIAASA